MKCLGSIQTRSRFISRPNVRPRGRTESSLLSIWMSISWIPWTETHNWSSTRLSWLNPTKISRMLKQKISIQLAIQKINLALTNSSSTLWHPLLIINLALLNKRAYSRNSPYKRMIKEIVFRLMQTNPFPDLVLCLSQVQFLRAPHCQPTSYRTSWICCSKNALWTK